MTIATKTFLLPVLAIGLVLAGCSDDDDGGGGGGDLAAFCELSESLGDVPSDDEAGELRDAAPGEIADDVDTLLDALESGDFESDGVIDAGVAVESFIADNCGDAESSDDADDTDDAPADGDEADDDADATAASGDCQGALDAATLSDITGLEFTLTYGGEYQCKFATEGNLDRVELWNGEYSGSDFDPDEDFTAVDGIGAEAFRDESSEFFDEWQVAVDADTWFELTSSVDKDLTRQIVEAVVANLS